MTHRTGSSSTTIIPPVTPVREHTLTIGNLSDQDVANLRKICANIGGPSEGPRGIFDALAKACSQVRVDTELPHHNCTMSARDRAGNGFQTMYLLQQS